MKTKAEQLLDTIIEYAKEKSPEAALAVFLNNMPSIKKQVEDAKKPAPYILKATYKISGISYTETVELNIKGEVNAAAMDEPLKVLLKKVSTNIDALQKTNLGVLSVDVLVSLHRGTAARNVSIVQFTREWTLGYSELKDLKHYAVTDYKGM